MIDKIKADLKQTFQDHFQVDVTVERPKRGLADLAIPLFSFAKRWNMSPKDVYTKVEPVLVHDQIDRLEFMGGFLNIFMKRVQFSEAVLNDVYAVQQNFGQHEVLDEHIVIDYSSPNIAKSFSVGHLRSTMIGNALKNIYEKCGIEVTGVNHLGDWGTQFGKMIVAYQKWGDPEAIESDPINALQALYVKFHDEAEKDESLEDQARDILKALEDGNETYLDLWKNFRAKSLEEFMHMYDILHVSFDSYNGEAFYNDKMDAIVDELEAKGLLKIDEGATIVDLGEDLPPALIKRSDGATLYMTRDLAALKYRIENYHAKKVLYVVGNEQQLHFKQLATVAKLLDWPVEIEHINFGLVLLDGKKMSTRGGKAKRLEAVINQAVDEAKKAITEKNPGLDDKDLVAKAVGVGAIIFNDLKNERHLDVDFNLANMLKFEGQTGPYLQYSSVRIESMLKDQIIDLTEVDFAVYETDHYFELIKLVDQFPETIERAKDQNSPSVIAKYILSLSQAFNSFYGKERILVEEQSRLQANLLITRAIQIVINEGLRLLGIESLKAM